MKGGGAVFVTASAKLSSDSQHRDRCYDEELCCKAE